MITEEEYNEAKKIVFEYEVQERERYSKILRELKPEILELLSDWEDIEDVSFQHRNIESWNQVRVVPELGELDLHSLADKYGEDIREIGKKYNVKIKFPYYYYGK